MKKVLVILLSLFVVSSIFAHEAFITAPIIVPDGQADEDGGWSLRYVGLNWFAENDYCADFNLTSTITGDADSTSFSFGSFPIVVCRAWKQLPVSKFIDIRIGKDQLSFGRLRSGKPSKNIQIAGLNVARAELMVKILGNINDFGWAFYYANNDYDDFAYDAADLGGRFTYNIAGAKLGAGFLMDNTATQENEKWKTDGLLSWEFDAEYCLMEKANVAFQVTSADDDNDNTDDLGFYTLLHYEPGFQAPIAGKITPYFGYVTKEDNAGNKMGENNMILGLNIKPKENAFIKLEYNMDSVEDVDATLNLEVGFTY